MRWREERVEGDRVTLDLAKVSPQVRQMGRRLFDRREQLRAQLWQASATFERWSGRWEELRDLAERRERAQRLASPRQALDTAVDLPAPPTNHRVVATDGSQIEPDRHGFAEYYLLNVGWAVLRYGDQPDAELSSTPSLKYELDDLFIISPDQQRRVPVQGAHLSARRSVDELRKAVELLASSDALPSVGLQDGTLLLWVLEERPEDFLRRAFLKPYVAELRRCQQLGRPIASYISRPRSTEVSALLRAATCRGLAAGCADCSARGVGQCSLDGLHDRLLFPFLRVGQRSAVFAVTLGQQLEAYYEEQRVHFFFLNVESEIARVEVPAWVAADSEQLDLVHGVVYDQARRGQGYPAALIRAHEQAIVRGADRNMVRVLLESLFARDGLSASFSEKEVAKRLRAV
jgi:hypothetical protein